MKMVVHQANGNYNLLIYSGCGLQFGPDVTKSFLERNGLNVLVRSHEVKHEGYEVMHDGKCITIFSAPNYCDSVGNKGAYILVTPDCNYTFHQFEAVPVSPCVF